MTRPTSKIDELPERRRSTQDMTPSKAWHVRTSLTAKPVYSGTRSRVVNHSYEEMRKDVRRNYTDFQSTYALAHRRARWLSMSWVSFRHRQSEQGCARLGIGTLRMSDVSNSTPTCASGS